MKSNNNNNIDIGTDNSIYEYVTAANPGPELEQAAENLSIYLAKSFDSDLSCSEILSKAIAEERVLIHPDSFTLFTNSIIQKDVAGKYPGAEFIKQLQAADDIGLYKYESGRTPELVDNAHNLLRDKIEEILAKNITQPLPLPTEEYQTLPKNTPQSFPTEEYYTLPTDNASTSSGSDRGSDSDSAYSSDFDLADFQENRPMVIFLTIASFLVINGIAWYVRTYHKDTLTVVEDVEKDDSISYSIYEPFVLVNIVLNVVFPTLTLCYAFRYIYLCKLKQYVKSSCNNN